MELLHATPFWYELCLFGLGQPCPLELGYNRLLLHLGTSIEMLFEQKSHHFQCGLGPAWERQAIYFQGHNDDLMTRGSTRIERGLRSLPHDSPVLLWLKWRAMDHKWQYILCATTIRASMQSLAMPRWSGNMQNPLLPHCLIVIDCLTLQRSLKSYATGASLIVT